jgi:hypothetical protein
MVKQIKIATLKKNRIPSKGEVINLRKAIAHFLETGNFRLNSKWTLSDEFKYHKGLYVTTEFISTYNDVFAFTSDSEDECLLQNMKMKFSDFEPKNEKEKLFVEIILGSKNLDEAVEKLKQACQKMENSIDD